MIARVLLAALLLCAPHALRAEAGRAPLATCRPLPRADRCVCSLASVEMPLTFAQASGLIEGYYRDDPDPLYETALTKLLRDCVFGASRGDEAAMPSVRLTQDGGVRLARDDGAR